ncbi:alpha/beta-hydrolase [Epithele typhae]|uniref:alpha/beta-hydrolase n=1 Tax=Epithele typhae TaxID=378194 RepID=UPI002007CE5C|nr:alpha/beta-hydrolase [Epithele typhae]KAH9926258.1 alpha/beta-hydrolase [Epithele typhae]
MRSYAFFLLQAALVWTAPTIQLDNATVVGVSDGTTSSFYGLPYAKPPVGDLRLRVPEPIDPYTGTINATAFGDLCFNFDNETGTPPPWVTPQEGAYLHTLDAIPVTSTFSEDCLNLNVIVPANADRGDAFPVVAYIFLGAFAFGGSSAVDGRIIVNRSVALGTPVIFVSMNYRLGPYGFLPGTQVKDAQAGNLGMQDQREALRWIQRYISAFGGDPSRVTLLGLSSGGVSSAMHAIVNNGDTEGLFHGIWAESGAIQPVGPIDLAPAQATYDRFAAALNCTNAVDSLECIRHVPTDALNAAGQALGVWSPHVDGEFITDLPQKLLVNGGAARVSVVVGNAEDEGTALTISYPAISNDTEFAETIRVAYYANISDAQMARLLALYPNDPALGAPYRTGDQNVLTPMYKRLASLAGDVGVDAVRKVFARSFAAQGENVWAYRYARNRDVIPAFGTTHGSEIPNMYGGGDMTDLLINFVNTLNPNIPTSKLPWPRYSLSNPTLLEFIGNSSLRLIPDTYREEQIEYLMQLNLQHTWPY